MKVIVTGSLGNIGKPLTAELVAKGHTVTVISSNPEKQKDIEAMGAIAAIGSLEDVDFLASTFTGADAVFAMVPPNYTVPDARAYYRKLGNNYARAIQQSGVKRVIHLSSYARALSAQTMVAKTRLSWLPRSILLLPLRPRSKHLPMAVKSAMWQATSILPTRSHAS